MNVGSASGITAEISGVWNSLVSSGFADKLIYIIPLTLILMILSFLTYSLVAGILASMTVSMEDYQQIQTPIMMICLAGYYLAIMAGMFEGSVFINNIDVSSLDDLQLSKIRKEEIGFVFQSFYLNNNMKAYEKVIMPIMLDKIPYKDKKEKGITILNSLDLEKRVNHYPSELSKGECQRVAIARALINNPNIILADEPTGNLDSKNERNIFELLKKLSLEGKCVIVVSHNEEIKKYADVVLKIRDGKLYE